MPGSDHGRSAGSVAAPMWRADCRRESGAVPAGRRAEQRSNTVPAPRAGHRAGLVTIASRHRRERARAEHCSDLCCCPGSSRRARRPWRPRRRAGRRSGDRSALRRCHSGPGWTTPGPGGPAVRRRRDYRRGDLAGHAGRGGRRRSSRPPPAGASTAPPPDWPPTDSAPVSLEVPSCPADRTRRRLRNRPGAVPARPVRPFHAPPALLRGAAL